MVATDHDNNSLIENKTDVPAAPEPWSFTRSAEVLIGAVAVITSVLYVLLQSLYVDYYDDFGVRPEEMGMDQLAVLSRATVPALFAVVLVFVLVLVASIKKLTPWLKPISWTIWSIILLGIIVGYVDLRQDIEDLADEVTAGRSVDAENLLGTPLVDVRAHPARVTWIEPKSESDFPVSDATVMFLGRGERVAAFYTQSCSTFILPADKLRIELKQQGDNTDGTIDAQGWSPKCQSSTAPDVAHTSSPSS